jgi:hypothetical protein
MLEYPTRRDDVLDWSDFLQVAFWEEEDGNPVNDRDIPEDYLFRPDDRFSVEFWDIAAEMAQLNDFCLLCLQQTATWLDRLKEQLRAPESNEEHAIVDSVDYTGEVIQDLEEKIPVWQDTNEFMVRAMSLMMLSAFTEKSLKTLCTRLAPEGKGSPKRRPGESKIDTYLRYLSEECSLDFAEPVESLEMRERCRWLRNSFAHGDWDDIRARVAKVHLRDAFGAVANLLHAIETAAWESPWGQVGNP